MGKLKATNEQLKEELAALRLNLQKKAEADRKAEAAKVTHPPTHLMVHSSTHPSIYFVEPSNDPPTHPPTHLPKTGGHSQTKGKGSGPPPGDETPPGRGENLAEEVRGGEGNEVGKGVVALPTHPPITHPHSTATRNNPITHPPPKSTGKKLNLLFSLSPKRPANKLSV